MFDVSPFAGDPDVVERAARARAAVRDHGVRVLRADWVARFRPAGGARARPSAGRTRRAVPGRHGDSRR